MKSAWLSVLLAFFFFGDIQAEEPPYKRILRTSQLMVTSDKRDADCLRFEKTVRECQRLVESFCGKYEKKSLRYLHYRLADTGERRGHFFISRDEMHKQSTPSLLRRMVRPLLQRRLRQMSPDLSEKQVPWLTGVIVYNLMNPDQQQVVRMQKDFSFFSHLLLEKSYLRPSLFAVDQNPPEAFWIAGLYNEHCAVLYECLVKKFGTSYNLRQQLIGSAGKDMSTIAILNSLISSKDKKALNVWFEKTAEEICFHPANPYPLSEIEKKLEEVFQVKISTDNDGIPEIKEGRMSADIDLSQTIISKKEVFRIQSELVGLSYRCPPNMYNCINFYNAALNGLLENREEDFRKFFKLGDEHLKAQIQRFASIRQWGKSALGTDAVDRETIFHLQAILKQSEYANEDLFADWRLWLKELEEKSGIPNL